MTLVLEIAAILNLVIVYASLDSFALDTRQNPKQQPQQNGRLQSTKQTFNETCGTKSDIAYKIEVCAEPLMDILEGRIKKWPRDNNDVHELCTSFQQTEKCIRDVSRRCAKGLSRTILSTLANSVQRARKRECSRAKYPQVLRMTTCIEKHQDAVHALINNATSRLNVVEDQIKDLDEKTNSLCCMVNEIESEIKLMLNKRCPSETHVVVALYRAVLEDVLELVCRNPKCKDIFKGYSIRRADKNQGIIAVLLRIIFSLGGDN